MTHVNSAHVSWPHWGKMIQRRADVVPIGQPTKKYLDVDCAPPAKSYIFSAMRHGISAHFPKTTPGNIKTSMSYDPRAASGSSDRLLPSEICRLPNPRRALRPRWGLFVHLPGPAGDRA